MSIFSGYKTKQFSDNQKFFVLDPSTGSPSFVEGSDLVSRITPNSNYVYSEATRSTAQATDYAIGSLIQTGGAESSGDNLAAVYLVVAAGEGDFPMHNGNELLIVAGDDSLQERLISADEGDGSDLVAHTGTANSVTESLNQNAADIAERVISVSSRTAMKAYDVPPGAQFSLEEGGRSGTFVVKSGTPPSDPQEGVYVVLANGNYAERIGIDYGRIRAEWFGAKVDNSADDYDAWQAAINWAAQAVNGSQGAKVIAKTGVTLISQMLSGPNRVSISGPNGRGLIFRPYAGFSDGYMFHFSNGTSSMFGSRLEHCYVDGRGFNMTALILSDAWQETCGLRDVVLQFDGTTQYGLLYQNGFGGAAYLPLKDIEIFSESTATSSAGIKVSEISVVGGFVLDVCGATMAGSTANPMKVGILMENDTLLVKGLHVEYANTAINMAGSGSLSADTVTGSANDVTDLITLGSGFAGKVSARALLPNGASGQTIKNNASGVNIPASNGMIADYVYPDIRAENAALAWVVFDGSDGSILAQYNVDSVSRSSTGQYVINYSRALPFNERVLSWSTNVDSVDLVVVTGTGSTSTTDAVKVRRYGVYSGAYFDAQRVKIAVFGNSVL